MSRIQNNTTELRAILDAVNTLPEGGDDNIPTQEKTVDITENGTVEVTPDDGYALSKVTANVNVSIPDGYIIPSGTLEITSNGQYDVTDKASVNVAVPDREIILQDKTITENGTYSADDGYDGLGQVTVEVPSSGGEVNMGTCTVVVVPPSNTNYYVARETVSNGTITYTMSRNYTGNKITLSNIRCDSVLWVMASVIKGAEVSDGELLRLQSGQGVAYKTPSTAGASAQITLSS